MASDQVSRKVHTLYEGPWSLITNNQINTPNILEYLRIGLSLGRTHNLKIVDRLLYKLCHLALLLVYNNFTKENKKGSDNQLNSEH